MSSEDESKKELLKILAKQGRTFMSSFASPYISERPSKRPKLSPRRELYSASTEEGHESDEWNGFGGSETGQNIEEGDASFDHSDDEFTSEMRPGRSSSGRPKPQVIVYEPSAERKLDDKSIPQRRSFMSSKVAQLSSGMDAETQTVKEISEEVINIKNDVALQRLIHTSLLPSHAQETMLDISGAQRKKSLAGRVLEVSDPSHVRLGQGERKVREKERDRAGKKVRDGMMRKKSEREAKTLAEAKEVGTYHPALKSLFGKSDKPGDKKRDRGLKMGLGRFEGGTLKLSRDHVGSIISPSTRGSGHSRGRGRGRGAARR